MIGAPSNIAQLATGLFRPKRAIGKLYPDIVIDETHDDASQVTLFPVEKGAPISDHIFHLPAEVILRCGWSNSSPSNSILGGLVPANPFGEYLGGTTYVGEAYQKLLTLKNSSTLLDVFTGKRVYKNMVIINILVVTEAKSEYALMALIKLREVRIVQTRAVIIPPKTQQRDPASTAPRKDTGIKQPVAVP